jgi:hypothetical protein
MIQVTICGELPEVNAFVHYLKEQPFFKVEMGIDEVQGKQAQLELELTTTLLKPSLRKLHTVQMITKDYQKVVIELLDAEVKKEGEVVTITGLNYDIFA